MHPLPVLQLITRISTGRWAPRCNVDINLRKRRRPNLDLIDSLDTHLAFVLGKHPADASQVRGIQHRQKRPVQCRLFLACLRRDQGETIFPRSRLFNPSHTVCLRNAVFRVRVDNVVAEDMPQGVHGSPLFCWPILHTGERSCRPSCKNSAFPGGRHFCRHRRPRPVPGGWCCRMQESHRPRRRMHLRILRIRSVLVRSALTESLADPGVPRVTRPKIGKVEGWRHWELLKRVTCWHK